MSLLSQRLNKVSQSPVTSNVIMYTVEGAMFQEKCLSMVSDKSYSKLIGNLVTAINNKQISVRDAEQQFNDAIWANR